MIHDRNVCPVIYSMHTNSSHLYEVEERQNKILDCNYLKVDIDPMVVNLYFDECDKAKLRKLSGNLKEDFSVEV